MQSKLETVKQEILPKITPTAADRKKMLALAKQLELKVSAACEELGIPAIVRLEGSLAKDTWIKEDPDVDVFMRLPTSIPRESLGEVALKIARKATEGSEQVERFAEHPYLEAFVDGLRVNIVPCYDAKPGEWLSATDRTPYHTDYVNEHLKKAQHEEVRLLKRYMKGIGVYGAEIKIGGFSGYLCELLVLHYGSFAQVLEAFAMHSPKRVIDMEGYYEKRQRELELLFPEPLVIVDPVDKARNVASAAQPPRLHAFVAASRAFLKEPSTEFFYPLKTQPLTVEDLQNAIANRGSALVFLTFNKIDAVPDVLWGQLHRTRKALKKQLDLQSFRVIRDGVWSEDKASFVIFVFELEQRVLPSATKHLGPPLEFEKECESFLCKYASSSGIVAGPFIDEGRWVVELPRKFTDAAEMLRIKLASGGRDIGVAELVAKALRGDFLVLIGVEIMEHYMYNAGFAEFLTAFLSGKPFWLETRC
jgi:tRNA nucleotidyltransferase (CCA-adding enzyme)